MPLQTPASKSLREPCSRIQSSAALPQGSFLFEGPCGPVELFVLHLAGLKKVIFLFLICKPRSKLRLGDQMRMALVALQEIRFKESVDGWLRIVRLVPTFRHWHNSDSGMFQRRHLDDYIEILHLAEI